MNRLFFSLALLVLSFVVAPAQGVDGDWHGALSVGSAKLNLVFHFSEGKCTMDSPDQGAKGIPAELLYNENDSLSVTVSAIGAAYRARLSEGKLLGTFSQNGMSFKLDMVPGGIVRNRPQTPTPPLPYQTQEISFKNEEDGATLTGTLTTPFFVKNAPLVVFVSGSGQQNRDEELFEHKPFAVIADRLAKLGIASFRYDDRGVGKSDGIRADLTTDDFKKDALCAIKMLREKGYGKIGIIGHSEGGLIAFMIAGEQPSSVDFIVSLAGSAVSGEKILIRQVMDQAKRLGQEITTAQAKANVQMTASSQPWYDFFVKYDPAAAIGKIQCPVYAANGSKDVQVYADENIGALKKLLNVKPEDRIIVYEGLNHLFQHASTGQPEEYAEIEETFSEEVISDISEWIKTISK